MLIKTSESFQWHHSEAGINSCTELQGPMLEQIANKRNISDFILLKKSVTLLLSLSQNIPIITILWVIFFCFCFLIFLGIKRDNNSKKDMWLTYFQCSHCVLTMTVNCPYFVKMARKKVLVKLTLSMLLKQLLYSGK